MPALSPRAKFASRADREQCAALIYCGSRSFHAASLVLPKDIREPAYALYAFCRLADDDVDECAQEGQQQAVAALRRRLDAVYRAAPEDHPVDRALADAVRDRHLPRTAFEALIEGLEWDAEGRRFETLSDLRAYSARVAGAVGVLMASLMGAREPAMLARASDLGVAMQLTNISRDVGEDARNGRVYLPLSWLREVGIDPDAFIANPEATPEIRFLIRRLLAEAEALYDRADSGIAALPRKCRPSMMCARTLYAEIGHELARRGHDSVTSRAVVPGKRKARVIAKALLRSALPGKAQTAPALPETQYLVDASARNTASPHGLAFVIDLCKRLNERDRVRKAELEAELRSA